ncbi:MAG: hypothetical protein ACKO86_07740, partial [Dolichospermum sp.]
AGNFLPFELKFLVTVATGKIVNSRQGVENTISKQQGRTIELKTLIWLGILLIFGVIVIFLVQINCC